MHRLEKLSLLCGQNSTRFFVKNSYCTTSIELYVLYYKHLRQGSQSVNDYVRIRIYLVVNSNEILDSEAQLVPIFIGGLLIQIQNGVAQFNPLTVPEDRLS